MWTVRQLATDNFGQENWDMNDMTNYSRIRQNDGNDYGRKSNFDDPWNSYGGLFIYCLSLFCSFIRLLGNNYSINNNSDDYYGIYQNDDYDRKGNFDDPWNPYGGLLKCLIFLF